VKHDTTAFGARSHQRFTDHGRPGSQDGKHAA
jgi:hypothetical protein